MAPLAAAGFAAPLVMRSLSLVVAFDANHLEHVLGEINADGANLHVDDPLR